MNMNYSEFKEFYIREIKKYLTDKEKRKINFFDMYYTVENEKKYILCIIVSAKTIFMYSIDNKCFENISIEEFYNRLSNGLSSVNNIPKIR